MDVVQKKNITLTVIAAILFMITVLGLFFNKMTTPRYLSNIELKINGLILIDTPVQLQNVEPRDERWLLLAHNAQQQAAASALLESLPRKIAKKTTIVENSAVYENVSNEMMLIAKPGEGVVAYFKPPFDRNKMKLTYSSVFTHR